MEKITSKSEQILEVLLFLENTDLLLQQIDLQLARAKEAIETGKQGKLSNIFISPEKLQTVMNAIIIRQVNLRPIFEKNAVSRFYEMGTAHLWTDKENLMIHILVQIPIADMTEKLTLAVLEPDNVAHSDISLAVLSDRASFYRFLSDSDYTACIEAGENKICQKRQIEIDFDDLCRPGSCSTWASTMIHDISDTEIIIISPKNLTAKLSCPGLTKEVALPPAGICRLGKQCDLVGRNFKVGRFSFHKHEPDSDFNFEMEVQSLDALTFRPVSQGQIKNLTISSKETIEAALSLNNETILDLRDFKKATLNRWSRIETESESTPTVVIAFAATILANSVLIVILFAVTIKLYLSLYKANTKIDSQSMIRPSTPLSSPSNDLLIQNQLDILTAKVVALETDLLALRLQQNPCTDMAMTESVVTVTEVEEPQEETEHEQNQ